MKRVKEFALSLLSRKLVLAIAGACIPILNSELGWDLSTEEVGMILGALGSFVLVEGVRDIREVPTEQRVETVKTEVEIDKK